MNFEACLDRIDAILREHDQPRFAEVYRGEPLESVLPGDRIAAYWWSRTDLMSETFGDVQNYERITVQLYWRTRADRADRAKLELEIWNCAKTLRAAFREDSQLSGDGTDANCDDMKIHSTSSGWQQIGDSAWRVVGMELELWDMNGEEISA